MKICFLSNDTSFRDQLLLLIVDRYTEIIATVIAYVSSIVTVASNATVIKQHPVQRYYHPQSPPPTFVKGRVVYFRVRLVVA